jgi:EAL domain-containing protein (putative c-di-GMP-specific phosphodiesterase class I)
VNSEDFLEFLKGPFAEHDIAPQSICFEITATTAIANLEQAAQSMAALSRRLIAIKSIMPWWIVLTV